MSDTETPRTAVLAGRKIGIITPTQGQMETLIRIQYTLGRGSDDEQVGFWSKQVDRLGTLLDSLIVEADRDAVDQLFLTGKIDHVDLMRAVFASLKDESGDNKTEVSTPSNTASKTRVRRK